MRRILLFAAIACLPLVTAQCKRAKSYAPKGYQLVWQDEFNEGTEPDATNRMPNNGWPRCGEIDIMEEVGFTPNEVSSSIHTQAYNHTNKTHKTKAVTIKKAEGDFHIYSLLWTDDEIITYVDGKELLHLEKSVLGDTHDQWPFHYPFHIILNMAWGGDWGGQEGVDESALPVTMEVDYVRVYQK